MRFLHCIAAGLLLVAPLARAASDGPPNIVLILVDDLGFSDTAPYGSEISTPAISALAARGVTFTNHHTAASCAPTRAMLLTGVDSHLAGVPNIPEAIPPEQAEHPHYSGTLGDNVVTVATLLRDAGYHTYMTGKWHLGMSPEKLPSRRGFERTIAMADTGADNWEKKPYLPIYDQANWFGDGEEIDLPDDFYSSEFFIDKTIEFIESNRGDGRPFFSYIPFQAVHIPVQAPRENTERYVGRYDGGWALLRRARLERARALGIVPPDTQLAPVPGTADWDALSEEDRRFHSKEMAVYAGMIDAMDQHIARLVEYLEAAGLEEDTVFVFTSDNGSEGSEVMVGPQGLFMRLWFLANGYDTEYETLGERGSYVAIGPSFASAAASPLAYYKFFAHEGGMRVPLIVAGGPVERPGRLSRAFSYVTDLAPTILELAGVAPPDGSDRGEPIERMRGASLLPLLTGDAERVHPPDEAIGYELAGNAALFKGDYKIVLDRPPLGDGEWHLFDIVKDPGEAVALEDAMPERFAEMLDDYRVYASENGVLPVPEGYDQRRQVVLNGLRKNRGRLIGIATGALAFVILALAWRRSRLLRRA